MRSSKRNFSLRRVVAVHIGLLALVLAIIWLGVGEVYVRAREEAIRQARERQELLAKQTARGIEAHYRSILSDLDLFRQAEGENETPQAMREPQQLFLRGQLVSRMLWQQLQGRIHDLAALDRISGRIVSVQGERTSESLQPLIDRHMDWLRSLTSPGLSPLVTFEGRRVHLAAAPFVGSRRIMVAIISVGDLRDKVLEPMASRRLLTALVLDDKTELPVDHDEDQVVSNVAAFNGQGSKLPPSPSWDFIDAGHAMGVFTPIRPQHVIRVIEPLTPVQGTTWRLVVVSALGEVEGGVTTTFRRTLLWGALLALGMGGILVSSAIRLIRIQTSFERERHDLLTRELNEARKIQLRWLPPSGHALPGMQIAAVNLPASHISGDFYNWFELPDGRAAVVIGDVTGHGMAAAFLMATTQLLVRTTLERVGDPGRCLEEVNRQLCIQDFNGQFVTMLVAVVDPIKSEIALATAGHPAPLLELADGWESLKIEPQLLLGVEAEATYPTEKFTIDPGRTLVMYTDGVPEARAGEHGRFGVNRMIDALRRSATPQSTLEGVVRAVQTFCGEEAAEDDLTLVAFHLEPTALVRVIPDQQTAAV